MNLYFVYLRQPRQFHDRRDDPFWEFGSFGRTGCHRTNLLHPTRCSLKPSDRLAFVQGGAQEVRAVGVTPAITQVRQHSPRRLEVLWDSSYRPLSYQQAPILVNNAGDMQFEALRPLLQGVNRSTLCGAFGSRFRASKQPIAQELSAQISEWFSRRDVAKTQFTTYIDAIQRPTEDWYLNAQRQGWPDAEQRFQTYVDL
jgi:hypothetical protein